jgi:hypothetical protein
MAPCIVCSCYISSTALHPAVGNSAACAHDRSTPRHNRSKLPLCPQLGRLAARGSVHGTCRGPVSTRTCMRPGCSTSLQYSSALMGSPAAACSSASSTASACRPPQPSDRRGGSSGSTSDFSCRGHNKTRLVGCQQELTSGPMSAACRTKNISRLLHAAMRSSLHARVCRGLRSQPPVPIAHPALGPPSPSP